MKATDRRPTPRHPAGFTLPAILVVASALLILAVGLMLVAGIERKTARSFVDRQRAELAAHAGLEEVKAILNREAANDDFLIIASKPLPLQEGEAASPKEQAPYLYLARGTMAGASVNYRYAPLFSAMEQPSETGLLAAPDAASLTGPVTKEFETLPWTGNISTAWIPVTDENEKPVGRYAYWVEDLQGKLDPRVAGNSLGENGDHIRSEWPFPPSRPLDDGQPSQNVIALHALDPASGDEPQGDLTPRVIEGRIAMISPDSVLGAIGVAAPLSRDPDTGLLDDPLASALERNVSPAIQSYAEQPLVPFASGISGTVAGRPKLNINRLLGAPRPDAIDEFSGWINSGLPEFVQRKGGFPEDYLKTLAAGAFDYADEDDEPTVRAGVYRGIDGAPFLSEIVLRIEYLGSIAKNNRRIMNWRMTLFGEFWNMTNHPVEGQARLSYEVALNTSPIGAGGRGRPFDDPYFLDDPERSTHDLTSMNGRYFSAPQTVPLKPDEYRFFKFATVDYAIDVGRNNINLNTTFTLTENEGDARGISVLWNNQETERIAGIVRDSYGMDFNMLYPKQGSQSKGKAAIPGHSYGPYGDHINNMGDPRISHYLRTTRLGENSYATNVSPNRRNIRRGTIFDSDSSVKRKHYGRVMPSEWPDGGHDSPVGTYSLLTNAYLEPDITKMKGPATDARNAPMRLSNEGRFYSVTELGNVYDPVMWYPTYGNSRGASGASDSRTLNDSAQMPASRNVWPDVSNASPAGTDHGGGNTLRIGRPEHERFDKPGWRAAQLLDLFHVGIVDSGDRTDREGPVVEINGQVNINTAGEDVLRALAAGMLQQDPELRRVTNRAHDVQSGRFAPRSQLIEIGTPTTEKAADQVAQALIRSRPFASAAELAAVENADGVPIFGNRDLYEAGQNLEWTDAAAEEVFGRVYDAATLRSRNFRVWVIGQSIAGTWEAPEVMSEARKVFTVFADPGERNQDGAIIPQNAKVKVIYENDF